MTKTWKVGDLAIWYGLTDSEHPRLVFVQKVDGEGNATAAHDAISVTIDPSIYPSRLIPLPEPPR